MPSSSFLPIIGVEVHVELKTKSKMFCRCDAKHFGVNPNTHVCPTCLGLPGALPVPNKKAIEAAITIAFALGCKINSYFWFDRKNYFYPDLPKGYQISQHFSPIGVNGKLPVSLEGKNFEVKISDTHLEEDTGKLIHNNNETLVDFNRSGVPLLEIVSEPIMHSAKEVKSYLKRVQQTIRWLGFSDCDMEKGSMRLEANISVAKIVNCLPDSASLWQTGELQIGKTELPPYKVEVKNLNSFKFVERAINYEIERQKEILEKGETPKQETRGFDIEKGETYSQRSKEVAKDYRYFPEPDIPPFYYDKERLKQLAPKEEQLPWIVEKKLLDQGVNSNTISVLAVDKAKADICLETIECLNKQSDDMGAAIVTATDIGNLIINNKARGVTTPEELLEIALSEKNKFTADEGAVAKAVEKVIAENPKAIADFKSGKQAAIGFLIGQVQRKTGGTADPNITTKLLMDLIK